MSLKIAILGAGPGGYVAAVRAAQRGGEVTIVENDNLGGTCLNWGCIPSKILKSAADRLVDIKHAGSFGIKADPNPEVDMQALAARKDKVIQAQRKGIETLLKHHSVKHMKGKGYIREGGLLEVAGADESLETAAYDRLIIATGSRPMDIPTFAFDGQRIISSDEALYLAEIPESIVIVGGGVIGCEFAGILSAFGSKVTVVEALDRLLPLPSVDADCSKVLAREMKKRKIAFHVNRIVESVDSTGNLLKVKVGPSPFAENLKEKDKKPLDIDAQKVLVCVGRSANTRDIGLENIDVATDERGWIVADDNLKTNVDGVFAIGDVLGPAKIMLAHVASTEGMVAAENALGGSRRMDYSAVPGAVFTAPEVGNVGLSEVQARETGAAVRADTVLFRTVGKAQVIGEIAGQAKIVSDADSGRILGVHIIGPHASDLIAEGTLAVKNGLTVRQLAETIHAHPTLAEIMMETGFKALDRGLHG
jgi:dihydrolipoamide dehydrogenase